MRSSTDRSSTDGSATDPVLRRALRYGSQWLDEDDIAAVVEVLRGDWLTTGPTVDAFETDLARISGTRFAVAVSSGTAALHAAYDAVGVSEGDEIVTTPLTFVATASTAVQLGARPRFADIDPETGTLDPSAAAAALTDRTRVIAPVDYAGHPADLPQLRRTADARGCALVSDAAHSLGATLDGRPVAALADIAAYSFHPVKAITTGEGGALVTDREEWCTRARRFRNHGIVHDRVDFTDPGGPWRYEVQSLGLNYRIPDILCALGRSQLRKLDRMIERRTEIARRYLRGFAGLDALELPTARPNVRHAWHLFVLRVRDAERRGPLFDALSRGHLGVQVHYPPIHHHPFFAAYGRRGEFPWAEDFARRALSIPIYPQMSDDDVDYVVEVVTRAAQELL